MKNRVLFKVLSVFIIYSFFVCEVGFAANNGGDRCLSAPIIVNNVDFVDGFQSEMFEQGMSQDETYNVLENIKEKEKYGVLSPKKWLFHKEQVEIFLRGTFYSVTPVTVQLVPSWICNYLCLGCSYGLIKEDIRDDRCEKEKPKPVMSPKDKKMDFELMKHIIDELKRSGVKAVTFTGGGEPFSHPRTVEMIQYARKQGLEVGIFSNGSLLDEEKIKGILDAEPTFIRLSINAGSEDVHTLLHGIKRPVFERVLKNLEILAKEKVKRQMAGSPGGKTEVHVGYIVNPLNADEINLLAERMRQIYERNPQGGLSGLQIRPTVRYEGGCLYPPELRKKFDVFREKHPEKSQAIKAWEKFMFEGGQFDESLWKTAENNINRFVEKRDNGNFIKGTDITVSVPAQKFSDVSNPQPKCYEECLASPWVSFVTPPNGEVSFCIEWGGKPEIIFGNLREQNFDDIWNGEKRKQIIEHVNSCMLHKRCPPVCVLHEMNMIFDGLKKLLKENKGKQIKEWVESERKKGNPNHWKFLYPAEVNVAVDRKHVPDIELMAVIKDGKLGFWYKNGSNLLSTREELMLNRAFLCWMNDRGYVSDTAIPVTIRHGMKAVAESSLSGIVINRAVFEVEKHIKRTSDSQLFFDGVVWHEGEHYKMYFSEENDAGGENSLEEIVQTETLKFFEKNKEVKNATLRVLDESNNNNIVGSAWVRKIKAFGLNSGIAGRAI